MIRFHGLSVSTHGLLTLGQFTPDLIL